MPSEKWPDDWLWVCETCKAKVVSTVQPQCWPCRKMMRHPTLEEKQQCYEKESQRPFFC